MSEADNATRVPGRPLIIGHRGASARITENTLEALIAARDAGADGVELDVQRCASGELVVFHDVDLVRLAGRAGRIAAMTWAELRTVRLSPSYRIPTLDDVLDALDAPGFLINIEIKSPGFGRDAALVDVTLASIARRRGDLERTEGLLVSSFDPVALARVRVRAPRLRTGYLFHAGGILPFRRGWPALAIRPHALHPESVLVTAERMAVWRRAGYQVNTWTVDDPVSLRRLAALGVDAIITNDPASARAVLAPPASGA